MQASGNGAVAPVNFLYAVGTTGNSYLWTLRVTDGLRTTETHLEVSVIMTARTPQPLVFEAESGSLTGLISTNGNIFQPVKTTFESGGRAVYNFVLTNAGQYLVRARVRARRCRRRMRARDARRAPPARA